SVLPSHVSARPTSSSSLWRRPSSVHEPGEPPAAPAGSRNRSEPESRARGRCAAAATVGAPSSSVPSFARSCAPSLPPRVAALEPPRLFTGPTHAVTGPALVFGYVHQHRPAPCTHDPNRLMSAQMPNDQRVDRFLRRHRLHLPLGEEGG